MNQEIFTVGQLAERWGVPLSSIRRMIKRKQLRAFRVGRHHRVTLQAITEHEQCGSSSSEVNGAPSGERAARPDASRSALTIVTLPSSASRT